MARSQNTGAFFVATLVLWLVSVIFEIVFNRRRELLPIIAGCFFYQFANWVIRFAVSKDPIFVNTSVSLLHSSITSLSVILILVNQWMANGPGKMFEHSQLFAATWPGAYPALCFSSGYFAYDQWDMLHYRLYSGLIPSILVHHLILLVCFTLALFRNITINYLILTLICERAATECLKTVLNSNVCGISSVFSTWGFMTMEDIDSSKQVYHDETYGDWVHAREILRSRLILEDDFTWRLPTTRKKELGEKLKYVGGVDLSFSKEDPCMACGALVVVDLDNNFNVVYEDFSVVNLRIPYIPGFLAFREAPVLLELLEKMKSKAHPFYPQLLMVDGNGLLHPHGFGLACHLGVLASLPTIGIGKNLLHVDGLTQSEVRRSLEADDLITLTGHSGHTWGVAMRSTHDSLKPIFISIGHRISLHTAVEVVKLTCKYRVPEPIRQADIRSRAILLKHPKSLQTIQIKKMHSIFLHTRKVRRMAGIRDAKSKIVRVEWVLSWITFFVARLATHILIIIKLVIDADKFNKGIELPLALSGMIGMNVLNIFLGLDLWKAYKRETNGLQNHQD